MCRTDEYSNVYLPMSAQVCECKGRFNENTECMTCKMPFKGAKCDEKENVTSSFAFGFIVLIGMTALLHAVYGPRTKLAHMANRWESYVHGPEPSESAKKVGETLEEIEKLEEELRKQAKKERKRTRSRNSVAASFRPNDEEAPDVPERSKEEIEKELKGQREIIVDQLDHELNQLKESDEIDGKSLVGRTRTLVVGREKKKQHALLHQGAKHDQRSMKERLDQLLEHLYKKFKVAFLVALLFALIFAIVGCFIGGSIKTLFNVFLVSNSMKAFEPPSDIEKRLEDSRKFLNQAWRATRWLTAWMPHLPDLWNGIVKFIEQLFSYMNPMKFLPVMQVTCTGANAPGVMLINLIMIFTLVAVFDSGISESPAFAIVCISNLTNRRICRCVPVHDNARAPIWIDDWLVAQQCTRTELP